MGAWLALALGAAVLGGASAHLIASRRPGGVSGERLMGRLGRVTRGIAELPLARRARAAEEAERRRAGCLSELPALLDVVTLGLSAGLSFDASLELYCSRNESELARAFDEAMTAWRIGVRSRQEALWELADGLGVPALMRFASVVGEALAFGAPLAETLEGQARVIRDEQRAQVEERIERVPVKMLIPLGTLVVPAMFLAILGPLLGSVAGG